MKHLSILLITKDSEFAGQITAAVAEKGGQLQLETNPMKALADMQEQAFDHILVNLPEVLMDQFEVIKSLHPFVKSSHFWVMSMRNNDNAQIIPRDTKPSEVVRIMSSKRSSEAVIVSAEKKQQERILVVEDNDAVLEMYKIAFQSEGFEVETSRNGIEGLTKLASFQPTVILLDIMMPQMDGYEFIKAVRGNSSIKSTIVVFTNMEQEDAERYAKELGANYFLRKSKHTPFQVSEMVHAGHFS